MEYNGHMFSQLQVSEMRGGIEQRIKQYEANIFDAMMNQKAEAATRNPNKIKAIRELQTQIDDLTRAIAVMEQELLELEMLEPDPKPVEAEDREDAPVTG